jgi:L-alanine-DL-glutamate epimerase-like enolase superfamily enzyme
MGIINRVEVHEFGFNLEGMAIEGGGTSTYNLVGRKGSKVRLSRYAVTIETEEGARGEYVCHWVGTRNAMAQTITLAPMLLGRESSERELIFDDMKREIRQYDHMGHGPLDIALWDLAGKELGCSIGKLLGAYRKRLPTYASTYHGDHEGGLSSPEAFADFAEHCHGLGYPAFKIHGWHEGDARKEAKNVLTVAKRVGDRMTLMLDPACQLRTFADALHVGRACDEAGYFWYEDPFRDAGTSAFAHKLLREKLKTPILQTEHIRGIEPKVDFLIAGGTDMLRADPEYDMGITGAMKLAHIAEGFGVDCEIHASGPAHRHCMAAIRNTNFYELALVGPGCKNAIPPVYTCGYSEQLEDVAPDGTFPVPQGPGLGVTYDWAFIEANRTSHHVFTA